MSGCYGTSAEDRARERELDRYLEEQYGEDYGVCSCGCSLNEDGDCVACEEAAAADARCDEMKEEGC